MQPGRNDLTGDGERHHERDHEDDLLGGQGVAKHRASVPLPFRCGHDRACLSLSPTHPEAPQWH
jgi:hypothetical protein